MGHDGFNPLLVGVLGVISGAIVVAFIHCVVVSCLRSSNEIVTLPPPRPPNMYRRPRIRVDRDSNTNTNTNTNSNSSASLSLPSSSELSSSGSSMSLTVYKYNKEFKEGMCAVCLGDFEENEEVRIMPECAHIFHVACIDMWLFSHGNCPLCRANANPRPHDGVLLSILNSRPIE